LPALPRPHWRRLRPDQAHNPTLPGLRGRTWYSEWRALRSKQYTYAIYRKDRKELLFDNLKHPYQLQNLAERQEDAQTLDHFRALLKTHRQKLDDTFEASTRYRDHWTKDCIITRVR
jgi:hypothetical protein